MAHFLVPYVEDYHRSIPGLDLDRLSDDERRKISVWNVLGLDMKRMRRDLDSLHGSVKRRKDTFEVWNELIRELERIRGDLDSRKDVFEVNVDVQGFQPKDLNVSIEDNVLTIEGSHEEKSENGFSSRQFKRSFTIPDNAQREQLKSHFAKDGRTLRIEAPLDQAVEEKKEEEQNEIPIQINHIKSVTERE